MNRLFLIDGHSLIFRMYYAFLRHPMVNSKRQDVSILFGWMKYLLELIEKEKPTHLAVCFDPPGKTFRHSLYPDYKGTRQATPELVIEALTPLVELCEAMEIPVLMVPGFEGDDTLGTAATIFSREGFDVYMVTPDKDFGQLISDHVFQYKPGRAGGPDEIWGVKEVCAKWGLERPAQVIDLLTLCGDSSDNVPGVDGIGEVGASKLLVKFGNVENIYNHLDELSPRQKEQMLSAKDHIELSRTLVTIKTDVPIDVTEADMVLRREHKARVLELFNQYEFESLKKYISLADGEVPAGDEPFNELVWKEVDTSVINAVAMSVGRCGISVKRQSEDVLAPAVSVCVCTGAADGTLIVCKGRPDDFSEVLSSASVTKCGCNLKNACSALERSGCRLGGRLEDVGLMHYLINPEHSHRLEILAKTYLNINLEDESSEDDKGVIPGLFDDVPQEEVEEKPPFKEIAAAFLLAPKLSEELESMNMDKLFIQIEEPLQRVLSRMETAGVKVDMGSLKDYADGLREDLISIERKVRESTGDHDLNVGSPKQVGETLFAKMHIDPKMKMRTGRYSYPTDEETLLEYADSWPVIYDILEYRSVKKLLGTYIDPFADWISPLDGRVHTTFNQTLTSTGRLSSSRPNLQNIPIRTDRGRQIRKAFVASSPDSFIVSADYSQIELRLMAHFCGDKNMCEAFCRGDDVHSMTASKIFGVGLEDVTADMRRTAKTANFGIMYGISAFGLAQRLRIPRVAAKKIIEDYFTGFPAIEKWIEQTCEDASRLGYVQTLFGRRRYIPDINSRNATVRALARRNAVNAPVQGTAADIIKMAMNKVDMRLRNAVMKSRMVLQIHDELMFEAPENEVEPLMDIIKNEMEQVVKLSVPLSVECNYGKNWLEAH